jgi:hypothetical protein
MAPPVLLVADDLSTIASVKRVLGREGYEVILATSAADAVIAWGHHLPGLVIVQPSVESDRGGVLLEELRQHPDAQLLHVVLLGESIPGFGYHVEPLPIDADQFAKTVLVQMRASEEGADWTVSEPATNPTLLAAPTRLDEPEPWRATRPPATAPSDALPQTQELLESEQPPSVSAMSHSTPSDSPTPELEATAEVQPPHASNSVMAKLFGDLPALEDELHRDVEAQAMASVESSLPPMASDDEELQRLEDDVRAEAARRRAAREALSSLNSHDFAPPSVQPVDGESESPSGDESSTSDETSFADVGPTPPDGATDPTASTTVFVEPDTATASEVLERAEAIALESRAVAASQLQTADAERRRADAELESLKRRAEHAESLVRREREARAAVEEHLEQLEAQREAVNAQAEERRLAREHELSSRIAELEQQLEETRQSIEQREDALAAANAIAIERAAERESLLSSLSHEQDAARKAEERSARLDPELKALTKDVRDIRSQLDLAAGKVKELTTRLEDERLAKMAVKEQLEALTEKLESAVAQAIEARAAAEASRALASEVEGALSTTKAELESARIDLEGERSRATNLTTDLANARETLETQRARADEADALAQLSIERLSAMEHRQVMNLALPGRRALGLPRTGSASLEQLAHLVSTLVAAQANVRLELGVRGGTRTLWFKKGALNGAESSFHHESLIDRARRDGLIDARQEGDLRLMRTATSLEQLDAMKVRGFLREIETVPLLQRATEAIALEAFSEDTSQYRLSDDPPGVSVLLVAVPRATLPLLAEALRRAIPVDALLETLGGAEAVCVATDNDVDLRAMGFSDKERKMLSWVDGEASVEDLTLAAGLKQETSFRALVVAKLLGVIEVRPAEKPAPALSSDLDVRRLDAKYDEVQDADYFSILGLTRSASGDDVQRAYRRLSEEFDPIKYTGHPDASLQQRAQMVSTLIEEAARALEDERRRAEYARHLLD